MYNVYVCCGAKCKLEIDIFVHFVVHSIQKTSRKAVEVRLFSSFKVSTLMSLILNLFRFFCAYPNLANRICIDENKIATLWLANRWKISKFPNAISMFEDVRMAYDQLLLAFNNFWLVKMERKVLEEVLNVSNSIFYSKQNKIAFFCNNKYRSGALTGVW